MLVGTGRAPDDFTSDVSPIDSPFANSVQRIVPSPAQPGFTPILGWQRTAPAAETEGMCPEAGTRVTATSIGIMQVAENGVGEAGATHRPGCSYDELFARR